MSPIPSRSGSVAALAIPLALVGAVLTPIGTAAAADPDPVPVIIEFDAPGATERVGPKRIAEARVQGGEVGVQEALLADYVGAVEEVAEAQDHDVAALAAAGIHIEETARVDGLLNAVVGLVPEDRLDELAAADGIAAVTRDREVRALTTDSVPSTGAPAAWKQHDADGVPLRGAGVTVAVIDTGVDYSIADLGGGFGEGYRVVDGYDFVNDDPDPMDDHYHGTHVAGIVAGSGTESVTGVAPEATLTAYKVLDGNGEGTLSGVLLGLQAATDPTGSHPADVVNLSLGAAGDGTDPIGRAAAAAVEAGTVVVAAAGNDGPSAQTIGTPAAADGVLAVGASVTGIMNPTITFAGASHQPPAWRHPLSANPPSAPLTARVVDIGAGFPEDYDAAGDVSGAVVAYQGSAPRSLGGITGFDIALAELAEQHGAVGVISYQPTTADPMQAAHIAPQTGFEADATAGRSAELIAQGWDLRRSELVMVGMYAGDYLDIKEEVVAGSVTATIGSEDATDLIASFSSRGPSDRLALKPEIVAPGVEIRSTVPAAQGIDGNSYRLSGTSMASPHVAGAAALVRQAHPGESAVDVRSRLIGSARALQSDDATTSPLVQGSGALAVDAAVGQQVTAAPDVLSLGLADTTGRDRDRSATVTLTNHGTTAQRLSFETVEREGSAGQAKLSKRELTIEPNKNAELRITVTPDDSSIATDVSGVIVATGAGGQSLRIPYALLIRPLVVQASPDVTESSTQVIVRSAARLEKPTLTVTSPSSDRTTVDLEPDPGKAGWYRAVIELDETGRHELEARGTVGDRSLSGTGSVLALGEDRLGAWEQVGPNSAAYLTATSPTDPDIALHMTTESAHPFVTRDGGTTWTRIRSMPVAAGWGIPVADPSHAGAFWVAVNARSGQFTYDPTYQSRLLYTPDAGETWEVLPHPDSAIRALEVAGDVIAAVTATGVNLSLDRGASWETIPSAWAGESVDAAFVGDGLLVQDAVGVWRLGSITGGKRTFSLAFAPEESGQLLGLAADERAVVVTATTAAGGAAWRSLDGGSSWELASTRDGSLATTVRILDGTTYLASPGVLEASPDYGVTRTAVELPTDRANVSDIDRRAGSPDDELLLTLEGAGLYQRRSGEWRRIGVSGGEASDIDLGVDADGEPVIRAATRHGVQDRLLSELGTGAGQEWGVTGREGSFGEDATDVEQSLLGARDVWSIRTTPFLGTVLERRSIDGTTTPVGPSWADVWGLAVSPHEEQTVAVQYAAEPERGILVSTDGFETWTSHPYDVAVEQIVFDPARPDRLWLAAADGLYRSDDRGQTIERVFEGAVRGVFIDPDDARRIVIGLNGGIVVSTDGGRKFRDAETPNFAAAITSIVEVELRGSDAKRAGSKELLVAGSWLRNRNGLPSNGVGAFVSVDGGRHWSAASGGLTALSIRSLEASSDGEWIYAAAREGGVVRTPVSELIPRN